MKDNANKIEKLKWRLVILEAEAEQQKEKDPKARLKLLEIGKKIVSKWPRGLTSTQAISQDRGV